MGETEVFMFVAQFAIALLLAVAWLIICKAIPALRKRAGFSYGVASVLAMAVWLLDGPTLSGFAASLLVIAILYRQWKRALKRQSLDTDTIISYENRRIF